MLCGRNAVQLSHPGAIISLDELAEKLEGVGQVTCNQYLLRLEGRRLRANDLPRRPSDHLRHRQRHVARAVYAKYMGS